MLILGLSNMRDASAALVEDGRIIAAAEEERFVRIKHVTTLPIHAIRYCLREKPGSARRRSTASRYRGSIGWWAAGRCWRSARCCGRRNSCV